MMPQGPRMASQTGRPQGSTEESGAGRCGTRASRGNPSFLPWGAVGQTALWGNHWIPPGDQRPTCASPLFSPTGDLQTTPEKTLWDGDAMQRSLPTSAELWGGGSRESSACGEHKTHCLPCSVACSLWTRRASLPGPGHTSLSGGMSSVLPGAISAVPS